MLSGHGHTICISDVAHRNDYDSFNLSAVCPDTENYTKVFLSHLISVCLTLVFSLSLPHTSTLSLSQTLSPPFDDELRVAQTLYASPWQRPSTFHERDSSAKTSIRPGNDIIVPSWYRDHMGPKLCAVLCALVVIQLTLSVDTRRTVLIQQHITRNIL